MAKIRIDGEAFPITPNPSAGQFYLGFNSGDSTLTSQDSTGTVQSYAPGAGTGNVTGPASSIDSEIALFNSTTGQLIKSATGSGYVKTASGVYATKTNSQVTADLDNFVGDSGAGGTKGLVPAPTTGDATKFLKGNGTWATVSAGSGDVVGPSSSNDGEITLFNSTTGKLVKAATGSGIVKATSGVYSTVTAPSGTIVGTSDTQVLTNKTIDAASNTISNISNTEIKSAAAIAVNKLAALTISKAVKTDGSGFLASSTCAAADLDALSGTNTGDQTITLTGDVTGTGNGSFAATIATGAVTDTKASFAVKPACMVVATSNQSLTGTPTIDGQATAVGSLILLTAQTSGPENGPWVAAAGAWARPTWYPAGGTTQSFQFITVFIRLGTTYQGSTWRMTTSGAITIDTTATTWVVTPFALNTTTTTGIGSTVQAWDTDLDALAGLSSTGMIARTGSGTASVRTITGTANKITVTNGDGVSGNPTLTVGSDVYVLGGTDVAVADGGTGASTASAARTNLGLAIGADVQAFSVNNTIRSVGLTIDGGGSAITTGVKGYIEVPYGCTINRVTMLADQSGSAVVDIWKVAYSSYPPTVTNTITASALPTISSATKSQDATLTGWTTSISAGDVLGFNVNSATTITRLHLILKVTTT